MIIPEIALVGLLLQLVCVWRTYRRFPVAVRMWRQQMSLGRNALLSSSESRILLDRILHRYWVYEGLRRLTVVMPLVGVLLTWLKFSSLSGGAEMEQLLSSSSGLYDGVAAGALMALLNQFMLLGVHRSWTRYVDSIDLPDDATGVTAAVAQFSTRLQEVLSETVERCHSMILDVQNGICERSKAVDGILTDAMDSHKQLAEKLTREFQGQLQRTLQLSTQEAADAARQTHAEIHENNKVILKSIKSVVELHDSVKSTLLDVRNSGVSFESVSREIAACSRAISGTFVQLNEVGLPKVHEALRTFGASLDQLKLFATGMISDVGGQVHLLSELREALGRVAGQLDATSTSLRTSTESVSVHYQKAGAELVRSAGKFKDLMDEKVVALLAELQTRTTGATTDLVAAAESLPKVVRKFSDSLGRADKHLEGLDDVSDSVRKSMAEMMSVTTLLRDTVVAQRGELQDWRAVLEQVPKSLRVQADAEIEVLIRHLGQLNGVVGEIVAQSEQSAGLLR